MENFYSRIRKVKLPKKSEINLVLSSFSKREKIFFVGFVLIFLFSTLAILQTINKSFMVAVPLRGGSVSEGIVGTPRFINPILANSLVDQDLVSLIYSGLMRKSSDGTLVPDLAESYIVSEDSLTYTFTLKNNLYFHDGEPLTVDDIIFTIDQIKDSIIQNPRKTDWDGVSAEKVDDKNIKFTLKQSYTSFLENTALGILPKHLWNDSPIELNSANTNPIGSGPYMISETNKQSSGVIEYYELTSFKSFALGEPYIRKINLHFAPNEEDLIQLLENGTIDQTSSLTPLNAKDLEEKDYKIESSVLPRVFGLFFNQNVNQIFVDKVVVRAIDEAIDKEKIIRDVLFGHGVAIDNPIPLNLAQYHIPKEAKDEGTLTREETLLKVQADLEKAGWKKAEDGFLEKKEKIKSKTVTTKIEFSISTGNIPELVKAAELIQKDLLSLGMNVDIKTFEIGNLNQGVIRPRKYDALLFGQIINHESDLFAFWHSSQRVDPGLNVAMYTNVKVDKILEDAFVTINESDRTEKYLQFKDEIQKDMPAIFLYSPNFIHVVSENIEQSHINNIISPSDRYLNAYLWFSQTENVWKIFSK